MKKFYNLGACWLCIDSDPTNYSEKIEEAKAATCYLLNSSAPVSGLVNAQFNPTHPLSAPTRSDKSQASKHNERAAFGAGCVQLWIFPLSYLGKIVLRTETTLSQCF